VGKKALYLEGMWALLLVQTSVPSILWAECLVTGKVNKWDSDWKEGRKAVKMEGM